MRSDLSNSKVTLFNTNRNQQNSKQCWKSVTFMTCIDLNKRECTLEMSVSKCKSPGNMSFDTGSNWLENAFPTSLCKALSGGIRLYLPFCFRWHTALALFSLLYSYVFHHNHFKFCISCSSTAHDDSEHAAAFVRLGACKNFPVSSYTASRDFIAKTAWLLITNRQYSCCLFWTFCVWNQNRFGTVLQNHALFVAWIILGVNRLPMYRVCIKSSIAN